MQVATAIALFTATFNLAMAVGHMAISRAPGWRIARTFSFVACTAALYSCGNIIFTLHDLPLELYEAALRGQYVWASLHFVAWLPYAYGLETLDLRQLPRLPRFYAYGLLVVTVLFAVTGWHIQGPLHHLTIDWAQVTYHYVSNTWLGDAYSGVLALGLALPLSQFIRRARAGEPDMGLVAVGFSLFVVTILVEALVAAEMLDFLSPADLGFLVALIPVSTQLLKRFVADAGRLQELTGQLRGEVRERTEERDRAQHALVEAERHASLGRLAAGVGHEINNPLAYVRLALERIGEDLSHLGTPAQVWESLGQAHDGVNRIQKVVEGLRTYSRRGDERVALDPRDIVRAAMKVANPNLRHVAQLEADLQPALAVMGDESRLVQALVNLLVNAAQAVSERAGAGHVRIRTYATRDGEACIEVADDGPGIDESVREHLGEPYFTTRGPGGGMGLGLFVTRGILDAHSGRLEFESSPGRGTRARMVLPAAAGVQPASSEEPAAEGVAPAKPVAGEEKPSVLIVDDEPLVLRLLGKALERDWRVTFAKDGAEALLEVQRGKFDVVLCDLMMPGISGMALADELAHRDPQLRERMLFMTGGAVTPASEQFLSRRGVVCLPKPLDMKLLLRMLRDISDRSRDHEQSPQA
ncbi:MAG: response regulator [Candidatus Eisenbacteria bacterium]|nr:response regulator [Candidatus Eisenbacteria bacterium]